MLFALLHAVLIKLLLCIFRSSPQCAKICGALLAQNINKAYCQCSWYRYCIYLPWSSLGKIKLLQCKCKVQGPLHMKIELITPNEQRLAALKNIIR